MGINISDFHAMQARLEKANLKSTGATGGTSAASKPVDLLKTVAPGFSILIPGQIFGGKNNMIVTRSGLHFPKKSWAQWRNRVVMLIKAQLPEDWKPINEPRNVHLEYVAGDKRRRDMPAIVDSIFHCLEKAGVVEDDNLIWISSSTRSYDKEKPFARIEFLP